MRRREFMALLGAAAWPLSANAQPAAKMRRIAVLMGLPQTDLEGQRWMRRFVQTLRDTGWRNGANIEIDLRYARDPAQMRMFALAQIELQPEVMHVTTTLATAEVLKLTRTIPVVFSMVNDPVALGFVDSLTLPGRNATGFTNVEPSLPEKWLELLKEMSPRINRVAVLFNPATGWQMQRRIGQIEASAAALGITLDQATVRDNAEIEKAVGALADNPQAGLILAPDPFFNLPRTLLVIAQAAKHRVPAVYPTRDFVNAGGLASLAVDFTDLQRRAALYVDHILKGATPAELPVQSPIKFEIVINRKTVKALNLTIPQKLMVRVDEMID